MFEIIGEAERETVHRVQLRIDALGLFEQLNRRVGLTQPHQDVTAAGQGTGIVRVYRYRASHFSLRLFITMTGDVDAPENNARSHLQRVKTQRPCGGLLRAGKGFGRRLGPAHRHGDEIGLGHAGIGGCIVRIELDRAPQQRTRLYDAGAGWAEQRRSRAQHAVISFKIFGGLGERATLLDLRDADRQCLGNLSGDFVLQHEDIGERLIKAA